MNPNLNQQPDACVLVVAKDPKVFSEICVFLVTMISEGKIAYSFPAPEGPDDIVEDGEFFEMVKNLHFGQKFLLWREGGNDPIDAFFRQIQNAFGSDRIVKDPRSPRKMLCLLVK